MNKSKEDQIQIQRKRKRVQCETKPDDDDDKILKSNAKPGLISCDENEHQLSQNWYSGVAEMSHLVQRKRDEHSNASTFVSGGSAEKSKKGCYADSAVDLGCIKEEVVDLTDIPVCSNKEIELEESDIVKEEPIEENQDSTLIEEHGNTLFVRLNIPDTEVAPTELRGKEDGVISANVIEINVAKEESDDEFDTETQMEIKDEPLESENQDFTKGEGVGPLKEANVSKDNSITPALDVQEESSPYGHLHRQAKAVIYNVNRYFLEEKANGAPMLPPSKAIARTAMATKLSETTVRRICSVFNQSLDKEATPLKPTFSSPKKKNRTEPVTGFDDFDKSVLRRSVVGFYERKEFPTVYKIKEELSEKIGYAGCENSLRKVLVKVGFKFVKVDGRKFLMERNDVIAARTRFLRETRQLKESGHTFVYVGETCVNQNCRVEKGSIDTSSQEATGVKPPTGKGARLIVLHAGTKDGFINKGELIFQAKNDDYHNQINAKIFEEWFCTQLLPNIPPNCVIVMDNTSHHSRQVEQLPTSTWRKADIKNWLMQKRVAVGDNLSKAELYELTRNFRVERKRYVADAMAKEAGHTVMRLPPYHCQYNPTEVIWAQVKSYIAKRNNFQLVNFIPLVKEALSAVTPEHWKQAVQRAEELGEHDTEQDKTVEMYVDSFIKQISESSDEFSD